MTKTAKLTKIKRKNMVLQPLIAYNWSKILYFLQVYFNNFYYLLNIEVFNHIAAVL